MSTPEPPSVQVFEHAYYIGNYMSGILYGVTLVMYFHIIQRLVPSIRHEGGLRAKLLALYSSILIVLLTIDISANAVWGEQMWITFRNEPGGIVAFLGAETSVWYETLGSTSVVAIIFLGDAFLLYRMFLMYGSRLVVIIFPLLVYLAGFALALIELVLAGKPNGNFFHGKTINFGTPYYTLTIAFNICVTVSILVRLRKLRTAVAGAIGEDSALVYTSVAAALIESAAPYSLVGIMFLIPYALGHGTAVGFGQVWAKIACLSPLLIVKRVVDGTAWGRALITQANSPGLQTSEHAMNTLPSAHTEGITSATVDADKQNWSRSSRTSVQLCSEIS